MKLLVMEIKKWMLQEIRPKLKVIVEVVMEQLKQELVAIPVRMYEKLIGFLDGVLKM
jgi:hypothetical protein